MFAESAITKKKPFGIMRIITDAFGICKMLFGIHQRTVLKIESANNESNNVSWLGSYRSFHGFGQAKIYNGGSV